MSLTHIILVLIFSCSFFFSFSRRSLASRTRIAYFALEKQAGRCSSMGVFKMMSDSWLPMRRWVLLVHLFSSLIILLTSPPVSSSHSRSGCSSPSRRVVPLELSFIDGQRPFRFVSFRFLVPCSNLTFFRFLEKLSDDLNCASALKVTIGVGARLQEVGI